VEKFAVIHIEPCEKKTKRGGGNTPRSMALNPDLGNPGNATFLDRPYRAPKNWWGFPFPGRCPGLSPGRPTGLRNFQGAHTVFAGFCGLLFFAPTGQHESQPWATPKERHIPTKVQSPERATESGLGAGKVRGVPWIGNHPTAGYRLLNKSKPDENRQEPESGYQTPIKQKGRGVRLLHPVAGFRFQGQTPRVEVEHHANDLDDDPV